MATVKITGFSAKITRLDMDWRYGNGLVLELFKPHYYKRFVWLTEAEPGNGDMTKFIRWLYDTMGLSDVVVRQINATSVRQKPHTDFIHYTLPSEHARMTLELVAYFTGEPK